MLPVVLRVEPEAIPAVRVAYEDAVARVSAQLIRITRDGAIEQPWLGDETSGDVQTAYNSMVMEAPEGPYAAMVAYQAELIRIRDQLRQIEAAYRRSEAEIAARWGQA